MNTFPYAIAFALATVYAVVLALYVAAGTDRWQRALHTLPARRLRGLLLGGPFLLALAACGGEGPGPIDPCPMATPTECAADDAGTQTDLVCADLMTDPQHCGNCDTACSSTDSCVSGVCQCVPYTKAQRCEPYTVNGVKYTMCGTRTDHCGGMVECDPCGTGFVCGNAQALPGWKVCVPN